MRDLVADAEDLWNRGHQSSAFALIMIAFAATARRRYPKPIPDNRAFKQFFLDNLGRILGTQDTGSVFMLFKERRVPLEDILYEELRCQLIHEGELPHSIVFTKPTVRNGVPCDVITLTDPIGLPESWVARMLRVVKEAPENRELL